MCLRSSSCSRRSLLAKKILNIVQHPQHDWAALQLSMAEEVCIYKATLKRLQSLGDERSQVAGDPNSMLFDTLSRACAGIANMVKKAESVESAMTAMVAEAGQPQLLPVRISFTQKYLGVATATLPVVEHRCAEAQEKLLAMTTALTTVAVGLTMDHPDTCWKAGLQPESSLQDVINCAREKLIVQLDGNGLRTSLDALKQASWCLGNMVRCVNCWQSWLVTSY